MRWVDLRGHVHDLLTSCDAYTAPVVGSAAWWAATSGGQLRGLTLCSIPWLLRLEYEEEAALAVTWPTGWTPPRGPDHAELSARRGYPTAPCAWPGCIHKVTVPRCVRHP